MTVTLTALAGAIVENPVLLLIFALCLGATVVNGATDAPNAIATVVGTRAMRPGPAILMAAVGNFVGWVAITSVNTAVAGTIFGMVDFGGDNHAALVALAAAMVAMLELTLKEFDLLKKLACNPGQAFTRPQLLEDVWSVTFIGETRTVDTHIQTLRRKLNDAQPGAGDLIETVRGVGYRAARGSM